MKSTMHKTFGTIPKEFQFAGFTWPRLTFPLCETQKARRFRYLSSFPVPHCPSPEPSEFRNFILGQRWDIRFSYDYEVDETISDRGYPLGMDEPDYDEYYHGIVLYLGKRRGFLAGWSLGAGLAAQVNLEVYESPEQAARAANLMAFKEAK